MKRITIILAGICMYFSGLAQTDTTKTTDTIHIGNMTIIKGPGSNNVYSDSARSYHRNHYKASRTSTNWFILDLGFANYNDQTNYGSAAVQDPVTGFAPGATKDWFDLRAGKSVNVNLWF